MPVVHGKAQHAYDGHSQQKQRRHDHPAVQRHGKGL